MTRIAALITILAAVGCSVDTVDNTGVEPGTESEALPEEGVESMFGGQSGSEDILVCTEISRTPVTDLSVPAPGATVTGQTHLDRLDAVYTGELDIGGDDPELVTLTVEAESATLEFVVYHDDFTTQGPDDDACFDRYEVDVTMTVVAGASLNEVIFTQGWGNRDDDWSRVHAGLWDEDVTGILAPRTFDLATATDPWLLLSLENNSSSNLTVVWFEDRDDSDTSQPIMDDFGSVPLTVQ
jgi:hypothetical protein